MKLSFLFIPLLFLFSCTQQPVNTDVPLNENIRINQIGYYPHAAKRFVVANSDAKNFIVTDTLGCKQFSGELTNNGYWDKSDEEVLLGDFSDFTTEGTYIIILSDGSKSYPFEIKNNLYSEVFPASVKTFYLHRTSYEIKEEYAGKWARPAGHPDTHCPFHPSLNRKGFLNTPGGWYDAGDYGKYIVNGAFSATFMMMLEELYPNILGDKKLNIPESGNSISDLLDEIRFELDWMLTMQDTDGGVFTKVTTEFFVGFQMPDKLNDLTRYVIGESTAATLDFASSVAMASRLYRNIDKAYSDKLLEAGLRAWDWAVKHPNMEFRNPKEVNTGEYGDNNFDDEFFQAASELYITTKDNAFFEYITPNLVKEIKFVPTESFALFVRNLAYYSYASNIDNLPDALEVNPKQAVIALVDTLLAKLNNTPYRISLEIFDWGSNSDICDIATTLCYAYKFTNDKKYLDAAVETVDYIFGKNATGYSFVTGFGDKQVMHPHHRLSAADGIEEPLPGFIVGGPNSKKNDELKLGNDWGVTYTSSAPAKCFVDSDASYASNEVCINWQAALVFVLGFLEENCD